MYYINKYKNNIMKTKEKVLFTLTKKRAHQFIKIWTDDPEEWFIEVSKCKNKTGEIISSDLYIKKDIPDLLLHLKNLGWEEKK